MSFLSIIGSDVKKVFSWLGSAKGQAVVSSVETVGEDVAAAVGLAAPVQAGINLINNWLTEILKAQALGAAAVAAGTAAGEADTTKAASVLAAMTPQVVAFAKANGLPAPTAANTLIINNALVTALDALGAGTTPSSATTQPAAAVAAPALRPTVPAPPVPSAPAPPAPINPTTGALA